MKPSYKASAMLLVILLLLSALFGCSPAADPAAADAENAEQAIDVQISYPEKKSLLREAEFVGRVESGTSVNVFAEVPAKILNTYKNLGEYVLAGDLLMDVDDSDMQTALLSAQSGLANAKLTMQKTGVQTDISTSGSGYITKQLTNGKTLSDLLDKYYETLRSGRQLDNTLDSYTAALWDATSAKTKAQATYTTVSADTAAKSAGWYNDSRYNSAFQASGISSDGFMSFVMGSATPQMELTINSILTAYPDLSQQIYSQRVLYTNAAGAMSSTAAAEKQADTALKTYEKTYDSSVSTIDSSIRSITKNYDYYAQTYNISDTMGAEETRMLNDLTMATLQLSCDSAQRAVDSAQEKVDKCKVYAPVSGTIIAKNAVASNYASSAQPMYVISSDDATPVISFNVSEDGANALSVGSGVRAIINGEEYTATVTEIANSTTANSGLFAAKAALPADSDVSRSGTVVKVKASTAEADNVLTLPLNVIEYDSNQPYVLVYREQRAVRCDLELGMSTHEDVEVTSGINAQDAVITTWHPELRNGSLVSCKELEGNSASGEIEVVE